MSDETAGQVPDDNAASRFPVSTYGCDLTVDRPPTVSYEHKEAGLFTEREVPGLRMPDGYKRSIRAWYRYGEPGE